MTKNEKDGTGDDILEALLDDPTRPAKQMAEGLGVTRQKLWREKKKLEDEGIIWGYTTVVDDTMRGWNLFVVTFKTKPITADAAEMAVRRVQNLEFKQEGVRVLNAMLVNGPYDILLMFAAPDRQAARKYINRLTMGFMDNLTEKPRVMDVIFPMIHEGKGNPNVERFRELVP